MGSGDAQQADRPEAIKHDAAVDECRKVRLEDISVLIVMTYNPVNTVCNSRI